MTQYARSDRPIIFIMVRSLNSFSYTMLISTTGMGSWMTHT